MSEPVAVPHLTDPLTLVHKTAALARLSLAPAEEARMAQQFQRILDSFQALSGLNVEGVEEMTGPIKPTANVWREDELRPCLPRETLLASAPEREGEFYKVPKTVGGAS